MNYPGKLFWWFHGLHCAWSLAIFMFFTSATAFSLVYLMYYLLAGAIPPLWLLPAGVGVVTVVGGLGGGMIAEEIKRKLDRRWRK